MRPFELNGRNVGTLIMVSLSGENRDYQPFSLGLDFSNPKEWKLLRAFTRRLQAEKGKRDEKVNLAAFKAALKDVYGSRRPAHFQDAGLRVLQAMKNLSQVPWPFIPILEDYEQVYYTGLQLTKDPGMNIIWAGSALLVVGLCIMFYMPHRKLWVVLQEKSGRLEVNVAGMTNRNKLGFERDFHEILKKMEQAIHSSPTQGERI
jgi:ResB protein required for cytochrome c biosynthesis